MKAQIYWIGALALFAAAALVTPSIFGWRLMEGFSGLFMIFFFAYCAIILVAQVFSALAALRSVVAKMAERKKAARRSILS